MNETEVHTAPDAEQQDQELAPTPEEIVAGADEPASDEPGGEQFVFAEVEPAGNAGDAELKAVLEAVIYITDEPLSADQMASALQQPKERISRLLDELVEDYARAERGLTIRELAGGFKMATKPEHHEAVRVFVKNLKPALKLSLAALETLAVIAYKQPITAPEIMEIRGVQGAGVLKTLLDRKLITTAGRKIVVGKPILYKTTKEFLIQFGLKDLAELPTLKEFEELRRLAVSDSDVAEAAPDPDPEPKPDAPPEGDPPEETPPIEEPPADQPPGHPDSDPDKAPVKDEEQ